MDARVAEPSPEALQAARAAWLEARVPYQQTEAYRFGNPIVDDWEGRVNAWPLDEGLIDDVVAGGPTDENAYAGLDVLANPTFTLSGQEVDATEITPALLRDTLHEADAVEADVATGYHAIEFLLWGQDLNGTGPGAGERPWTDYARGDDCTGGHCDRRADYLTAATDLLVSDLEWMVGQWAEDGSCARGRGRGQRRGDPHGHGLAVLRRAGGRAHEAGRAAERPRGGARLLLRQHPQQPLPRRARNPQRLPRPLRAHRRLGGGGPVRLRPRGRRPTRRWTPR